MTGRANRIIEQLRRTQPGVRGLDTSIVARTLRAHGLLPSETGWVLHHVFGISMPEAVHVAIVAAEAQGPARVVGPGTLLPSESVCDEAGPIHFGRR